MKYAAWDFAPRVFASCLVLATAGFALADDSAGPSEAKAGGVKPIRVALVTGVPNDATRDVMALAEASLADRGKVVLLERAQINKLLEEHELTIGGMTDAESAVHVGKILTVDVLAAFEGDPKAKAAVAQGLVVFDARSGVRLCDETLPTDGQQAAATVAAAIEMAADKYRQPVRKTVSVVGVRNVDLPSDKTPFCEAIARLLERRLVGSPDVSLLERRGLEHIGRERAVSADAPNNGLLASLQKIELEFARDGENGFMASAILTDPDGKSWRVKATASNAAPHDVVAKLIEGVLGQLKATASKAKPNLTADANRLIVEAVHEQIKRDFDRAVVLAEAVLAMTPDDSGVMSFVAKMYHHKSLHAFDPNVAMGGYHQLYRWVGQTDETRKEALANAIRSVELLTAAYERQKSHGGFKKLGRHHLTVDRVRSGFTWPTYVYVLQHTRGGWNDENRQLMTTLSRRLEHLMLDVLLPYYAEQWPKDSFRNEFLFPYAVILGSSWKYTLDSSRWTDVMVENGRRIINYTSENGTVTRRALDFSYTYVYPLTVIVAPRPRDNFQLTSDDRKKFRALFKKMQKHRLGGIRAFGMLGDLWLDQQSDRLTDEDVYRRSVEIFAFAKKEIEAVSTKTAVYDRLACYEVMGDVVSCARLRDSDRGRLMDDLLEYMVGRKEAGVGVVGLCAFPEACDQGHYASHMELASDDTTWWPNTWQTEPEDRDMPKVHRLTRELQSLLASGKARIIDDQQKQLPFLVRRALETQAEADPRFRVEAKLSPEPWRYAKKLITVDDQPGMSALSRGVVRGEAAYVAGVFMNDPVRVKLFRVSLTDGKIDVVGQIDVPKPRSVPDAADHLDVNRFRYPLRLAPSDGGALHYTIPCCGGILVFPLDGSAPKRITPENTPGMPTDVIDRAVVVGEKLFAMTSSAGRDKRSYVHWRDPKKGGWQTIAASDRIEHKTPLDEIQQFMDGATYDPLHHRVVLLAKAGLYQFDVETQEVRRLARLGLFRPTWYGRVSEDRLWFTFCRGFGRFQIATVIEYDLRTKKWRELVHWPDAAKASSRFSKVESSETVMSGNWDVSPPFTETDGWLYCFEPLSRVTFDGRIFQQFKDPIGQKPVFSSYDQLTPDSNTLEYLPKRRALLYGNHKALWYLQLPDQPDPPPASKEAKKPKKSDKPKKPKKAAKKPKQPPVKKAATPTKKPKEPEQTT